MDLELLQRTLAEAGQPAFRARQVWEWAARGTDGYEAMTNLPVALRATLAEVVPFSTLTVVEQAESVDGTVKTLFHTADGRAVEAVLMRYRDPPARAGVGADGGVRTGGRRSLCVSSQSGCPLTCTFCATGTMKFGRNLTASEILDQALHFRRLLRTAADPPRSAGARSARARSARALLPERGAGCPAEDSPDHAVFMGMGEPMMNLEAVLDACRRLPAVGITHRRTTISTVGWIPGIERLATTDMPLRLAISLHAADDALRSQIMPVNDRYPLADVLAACRRWHAAKRRPVFVEYVMLAGVNDRYEQAVALARVLDPKIFKVNLIPYNPSGSPYDGSRSQAIEIFRAALDEHGMRVTVRLTRGRDIAAACGQLAAVRV